MYAIRSYYEIVERRIVYGEGRPGPWFDYGEWALMEKHVITSYSIHYTKLYER